MEKSKEKLTNLEAECYKSLQHYQDGFLRRYTEGQYRLQDKSINPIINIPNSKIETLIAKGWLKLLADHKFTLL